MIAMTRLSGIPSDRDPGGVTLLDTAATAAAVGGLAALLHACVHDGASIGFILPFAEDEAAAFWAKRILPGVGDGAILLLAVREGDRIVATGQLALDTPANQPHRAEIRKVLVHPEHRRRGHARRIMAELEALAVARGRSLITLDTRTGDAAEPLYASMGYETTGVIPGYCLDAITGALDSTTVMYKQVGP